MIDIGETFAARRFGTLSYVLHGALAAQDYLGDTAGDSGVPMPDCTLNHVHYHLGSADDGNTDVVFHNETQGTSATVTLSTNTEDDADLDLGFNEGDEFAIEVDSVTTPGSDLSLLVEYEQREIV